MSQNQPSDTHSQKNTENPVVVMDRDEQMVLSLLTAIEEEPETTQKDLSTQLGVAVGLVNSYLKRVIYKGYVKTKNLERRRLRYLLTPKGIREKSRLTYEFLEYSYQFIRKVRSQVHEVMAPYAQEDKKRVIFWGSGEVAELAYIAGREMGLELIAIVDPKAAGKRCVDRTVLGVDEIETDHGAQILLILSPIPKDKEKKQEIEQFATNHAMECVFAL
ncbi:winged helix-turn-helix transcriptional regulator [bacterium]|nr:winged helix-turn-helix transcriptional regulator [bacterium]